MKGCEVVRWPFSRSPLLERCELDGHVCPLLKIYSFLLYNLSTGRPWWKLFDFREATVQPKVRQHQWKWSLHSVFYIRVFTQINVQKHVHIIFRRLLSISSQRAFGATFIRRPHHVRPFGRWGLTLSQVRSKSPPRHLCPRWTAYCWWGNMASPFCFMKKKSFTQRGMQFRRDGIFKRKSLLRLEKNHNNKVQKKVFLLPSKRKTTKKDPP